MEVRRGSILLSHNFDLAACGDRRRMTFTSDREGEEEEEVTRHFLQIVLVWELSRAEKSGNKK